MLWVATVFVGSGLLFVVQPMIAKSLLSRLGGAPAVWTTSVLFFQVALLAGYSYAHWDLHESASDAGLEAHRTAGPDRGPIPRAALPPPIDLLGEHPKRR